MTCLSELLQPHTPPRISIVVYWWCLRPGRHQWGADLFTSTAPWLWTTVSLDICDCSPCSLSKVHLKTWLSLNIFTFLSPCLFPKWKCKGTMNVRNTLYKWWWLLLTILWASLARHPVMHVYFNPPEILSTSIQHGLHPQHPKCVSHTKLNIKKCNCFNPFSEPKASQGRYAR